MEIDDRYILGLRAATSEPGDPIRDSMEATSAYRAHIERWQGQMTEKQLIEPGKPGSGSEELLDVPPQKRMGVAILIADELAGCILQQCMSVKISGKDYVLVEGWQTLAFLCGLTFAESAVERSDTYWECSVNLLNGDGRIVGHGSAICEHTEGVSKRWTENNRRSMAITRAIGKCGRVSLGWVMQLAGYSATPAEEMPIEGETGPAPGVGQIPKATEPAPVVEYTTPPPAPEPVPLTESEQSVLDVIVKCGQKGDAAGLAELRENLNARRETLTPQAALAFRGAIKLADAECNAADML